MCMCNLYVILVTYTFSINTGLRYGLVSWSRNIPNVLDNKNTYMVEQSYAHLNHPSDF